MKCLPDIDKEEIHILEPSVGTGNFIPFIIKKYASAKFLKIDVVDIDPDVIAILKFIISKHTLPNNISINFINDDFLLHNFNRQYDLVIGNPPFNKLGSNNSALKLYRAQAENTDTANTFSFFSVTFPGLRLLNLSPGNCFQFRYNPASITLTVSRSSRYPGSICRYPPSAHRMPVHRRQ